MGNRIAPPLPGPAGPTGATGATGLTGPPGGPLTLSYQFSSTTTNADPGSGVLRLSSASQNSSPFIYVSNVDQTPRDVSATLISFSDSTNPDKGVLRLQRQVDPSAFITFTTGATTAMTGYVVVTVTNVVDSSAGSPFTNGDLLWLLFAQIGNKGDPGGGSTVSLARPMALMGA